MTETLDLDHFDEDTQRQPDARLEPEIERCSMCGADAFRMPGEYGKIVCRPCRLEAKLPSRRRVTTRYVKHPDEYGDELSDPFAD